MNQNPESSNANAQWERSALEHLLLENLKENRKARRWRAILRILTLIVLVGLITQIFDLGLPGSVSSGKHTALVSIEGEISPNSVANALDINSALSAAFESKETPAQREALEKLETVLALIEGWIDAVVTKAAGERLPSMIKLRETQQRRRATNSPTQQLFATLVGLEVSPRRTREAIAFWEKIAELKDIQARDQI